MFENVKDILRFNSNICHFYSTKIIAFFSGAITHHVWKNGTWKKCNYFRGIKMTFITMESKWFFVWCNVYLQQFRFTICTKSQTNLNERVINTLRDLRRTKGRVADHFGGGELVMSQLYIDWLWSAKGIEGLYYRRTSWALSCLMYMNNERMTSDCPQAPGKNSRIRAMPYAGYAVYTACGFM